MSKQNPTKTAKQISKTDFYFVTCFYSLCDICITSALCFLSLPLKLFTFMPSWSGRMALRKMPTRAARAKPENETEPICTPPSVPYCTPMDTTMMRAATKTLRDEEKSTEVSTRLRTPTAEIIP